LWLERAAAGIITPNGILKLVYRFAGIGGLQGRGMSESAMMTVLSHFEQHFVPIPSRRCAAPYRIACVESFSAVGR